MWAIMWGQGADVIDAQGRLVLPGFIDSHNHVRLGSDVGCVQLAGAGSLAEAPARIAAWLADYPAAEWVEGEGWTTPRCGRTRRMPNYGAGARPSFEPRRGEARQAGTSI
jgi:predicted amidohydrolase YtcJ